MRQTRDHPRGCGENRETEGIKWLDNGSPPRMRGKLFLALIGALPQRITPADAGKTMSSLLAASKRWDHPRGCGENCTNCFSPTNQQGSPPRMRGKPGYTDEAKKPLGITPADAGKTFHVLRVAFRNWDHPRGCGENETRSSSDFSLKGSPPRMRGKQRMGSEKTA